MDCAHKPTKDENEDEDNEGLGPSGTLVGDSVTNGNDTCIVQVE
jgi:hypothetical protein